MTSEAVLERLSEGRIVVIVRGDFRGAEVDLVGTLVEAGIRAVEVTLNSPGALGSIRTLAEEFGSRIAIGAGTVLRAAEVEDAAEAGARFIVSPNRNEEVIGRTKRVGLASFPGCFTASEIVEAVDAGADAVKLFPARMIEPSVIRDLRGPLNEVRMIPTGGVTPERARAYLAAGAWALGVGATLIDRDVLAEGGLERLARLAGDFVAATRDRDDAG